MITNSSAPKDIDLSLEYSFLRLPYNYGVKVFKDNKRVIEKELSKIVKEITKLSKNSNALENSQSLKNSLEEKIKELKILKEKLKVLHTEEECIYKTIQNRIIEFDDIQYQNFDNKPNLGDKRPHPDYYLKKLLNRNLIEYLLRYGKENSSKEVQKTLEKDYNFDIERKIIENNKNIFNQLKEGNVDEALQWCRENRSKLNRTGSNFEFRLLITKYLTKVISNESLESVQFLRENLNLTKENGLEESALKDLRNASRLLILPNPKDSSISKDYLEKEACLDIAKEFIIQSAEVEAFAKNSNFESYIQSGIAALKTVFCSDQRHESINKRHNNLCPCCNSWIKELGKKVPSTPKLNSFLICRISG